MENFFANNATYLIKFRDKRCKTSHRPNHITTTCVQHTKYCVQQILCLHFLIRSFMLLPHFAAVKSCCVCETSQFSIIPKKAEVLLNLQSQLEHQNSSLHDMENFYFSFLTSLLKIIPYEKIYFSFLG